MTTQRFFDPQKKTRITVTTPQQRKKKNNRKRQFASNTIQQLMQMQMQLMMNMTQTQNKANQNYLTTPVDRWTEIDKAKNELVAMGKNYDDISTGISALKLDIEQLNMGLSENMSNWNDFINKSSLVSPEVTPKPVIPSTSPTTTVASVAPPAATSSSFPQTTSRFQQDRMSKRDVLDRLAMMNVSGGTYSTEYRTFFTKTGKKRAQYKDNSYNEIFTMIENNL